MDFEKDLRLIEAGFPCHQVGAETQRERDTGKAPPVNRLHVWWARRPLTPSRAAILGSLLPADADPAEFLQELGIEKRVATIHGQEWVLTGKVLDKIERDAQGEFLSSRICNPFLEDENARRRNCEETISKLVAAIPDLEKDSVLQRWRNESQQLPLSGLPEKIRICTVSADPAHVKERIVFAKRDDVKRVLGKEITWSPEDLYGYSRAFTHSPSVRMSDHLVLDLTSGGGSIPFEALRLGGRVIANELNPVAATILSATLQYPAEFGVDLAKDIERWGCVMLERVSQKMEGVTPFSPLPREELEALKRHCANCPELLPQFSGVEF
ncbi:MAG TPA: DUF1156 domain-containing protein, partial [Synergistaceae bacterium]|nr:DUF1156 domain-containing protein [Synergistaceae bacterium]